MIVFRLFSLLFVLMFAVSLGDTLSESLLLTYFSSEKLPLMYMANSAALFIASLFALGWADRMPRASFFHLATLGLLFFLAIVRIMAGFGMPQAFLALFTVAYAGKIILFLSFWTVANDLCDPRQAKTLFPKIGAGGVLGGIIASFSTAGLVQFFGPTDLIFLWGGLLVIASMMMEWIARANRTELFNQKDFEDKRIRPSVTDNFRLLSTEPLLKVMGLIYFGIFFLLINLDYHFLTQLRISLSEKLATSSQLPINDEMLRETLGREIAGFLGIFRGIASTITFLIQITFAGTILKHLGTVRSMYIMPVIFSGVFVLAGIQGLAFFPESLPGFNPPFSSTLFLIILAGGAMRLALFDSIFSPNFQIFFSSLPRTVRGRGKMLLEGMLKPLAISLAGASTFFLDSILLTKYPFSIYFHFFGLFMVGVGIFMAIKFLLSGAYSRSLSDSLGGARESRIQHALQALHGDQSGNLIVSLNKMIRGNVTEEAELALELLEQIPGKDSANVLVSALTPLSQKHPLRKKMLNILGQKAEEPDFPQTKVTDLLHDWETLDEEVISMVLGHLPRFFPDHSREILIRYSENNRLVLACRAAGTLLNEKDKEFVKIFPAWMERRLNDARFHDIPILLCMVSCQEDEDLFFLFKLAYQRFEKMNLPTLESNLFLCRCLCRIPGKDSLEWMMTLFCELPEQKRKSIYPTLCHRTREVLNNFNDWVHKWDRPQKIILWEYLYHSRVILNQKQRTCCRTELEKEISHGRNILSDLRVLSTEKSERAKLFYDALCEGPMKEVQKCSSHLLALSDSSERLYFAASKLMSKDRFQKATALEAAETVLGARESEALSVLFLTENFSVHLQAARTFSRHQIGATITLEEVTEKWIQNSNYAWTAACALFYLMKTPAPEDEKRRKKLNELIYGPN